jgi:multiple sugar transport system substrate-binding protein
MTGRIVNTRFSRRAALSISLGAAGGVLLGGCSSGGSGGSSGQVIFSSYLFSDFKAALGQVLQTWKNEHPDAKLTTQYSAGSDYWTKVQTEVAAGTPPSLGIGENDLLVSYAKSGVLASIDDRIKSSKIDLSQYPDSAVSQYRWAEGDRDSGGQGGKMYGLPSDAQGFIFAYNKKLFDAAGVKYPTDDWTWDDVVGAAKEITKPGTTWGVLAPSFEALFRGNFVYSAGGSLTNADFTRSAIDSPESAEAWTWVWDLIHTHNVAPRPQPANASPVDLFAAGKAGMTFDGIWQVAAWQPIKAFDWDIAMLPKHPSTGKRTTSVESDGWWMYNGAKDPDTAWSLLSFLASERAQKKFASLNYIVPPSNKKLSQSWYDQKPPASLQKALTNVLQDSKKRDGTFNGFSKVDDLITPILQKSFLGNEDVHKSLAAASAAMTAQLAKSQNE